LSVVQKSAGLAGDDEFLVRRDDHHLHLRVGCADDRFAALSFGVEFRIKPDAEVVQIRANRGANSRAVLADAGGEADRVRTVQLKKIAADPAPRFADEYVERELRFRIPLLRRRSDVADV